MYGLGSFRNLNLNPWWFSEIFPNFDASYQVLKTKHLKKCFAIANN